MGDWDRVIEEVSKISNFVTTGDGRLGWEFVIYAKLGKDSVMEEVSTITNFVITGAGVL